MVELRDHSELQIEAREMMNDMTPISRSLAERMVKIDSKVKKARPDIAITLARIPRTEVGCKICLEL